MIKTRQLKKIKELKLQIKPSNLPGGAIVPKEIKTL